MWEDKHPYRWRTWIRAHLPWFLIDFGIARKGHDCEAVGGWHHWYNVDDGSSGCYHCEVVRPGLARSSGPSDLVRRGKRSARSALVGHPLERMAVVRAHAAC